MAGRRCQARGAAPCFRVAALQTRNRYRSQSPSGPAMPAPSGSRRAGETRYGRPGGQIPAVHRRCGSIPAGCGPRDRQQRHPHQRWCRRMRGSQAHHRAPSQDWIDHAEPARALSGLDPGPAGRTRLLLRRQPDGDGWPYWVTSGTEPLLERPVTGARATGPTSAGPPTTAGCAPTRPQRSGSGWRSSSRPARTAGQ